MTDLDWDKINAIEIDWPKLNEAREIVTYAHVHTDRKVASARAICEAADLADLETRGEYADESESILAAGDDFFRAYCETAAWCGVEYKSGDVRADSDKASDMAADDIHPATLREMQEDCTAFLEKARPIIEAAIETGEVTCGPDFDEWGRAGHDFWLTRNGHGAGFWDGDWPEPMADQLDTLAKGFGEVDLMINADGSISAM